MIPNKAATSSSSAVGGGVGSIGLLILFFWGDPDIADAIIHFLMNAAG